MRQAMRRLAADISALHSQPLPPNYFFAPDNDDEDDLTQLNILLAGPAHTPYAEGVWRLHLNIPVDYPAQPPTANFRTAIFHPNVHPETGGVCVETLKRDWDSKLTLRDVFVTISCLLIQPNPDSALNAEAGSLIQEDYEMFARRARLMTSIHASVPASLSAAVQEARLRGQESEVVLEPRPEQSEKAPIRQRRQMIRATQRGRPRRSDGSPINSLVDRRHAQSRMQQQERDDVFQTPQSPVKINSDEIMDDADQENFAHLYTPMLSASTPRRPPGPSVPLGELVMSSDDDDNIEPEYPPSPKKSPAKSPVKRQLFQRVCADSSRQAARDNDHTPLNLSDNPMHACTPLEPCIAQSNHSDQYSILHESDDHSVAKEALTEEHLWALCGDDVSRWNRCDFDQQPFDMIATRW